ncbi:MAG TPA: hypothetical protein VF184_10320 [Phycisphaeraceae bacterium]
MTHLCGKHFRELADGRHIHSAHIDDAHALLRHVSTLPGRHVVVTHDGDWPLDERRAAWLPPNVVKWFATNVCVDHPRVEGIPVGIANPSYWHGDFGAIQDVVARTMPLKKARLLHAAFALDTNPPERVAALLAAQNIEGHRGCYIHHHQRVPNYRRFLDRMAEHRFVLSPPGNGIDCHRTWEALYLGCVPVCKRSRAMSFFADELPIALLDDWSQLSESWLEDQWDRVLSRQWNWRMLSMDYWRRRIHDALQGDG